MSAGGLPGTCYGMGSPLHLSRILITELRNQVFLRCGVVRVSGLVSHAPMFAPPAPGVASLSKSVDRESSDRGLIHRGRTRRSAWWTGVAAFLTPDTTASTALRDTEHDVHQRGFHGSTCWVR